MWWEPDVDLALHIVRQTLDDYQGGKNIMAQHKITQSYSWQNAADVFLHHLEDL